MNWYLKVLKEHYADFSGRARREEFWMFFLFNIIALIILSLLGTMVSSIFSTIMLIYYLGTIVPYIAVGVRRMHDVGKSGWFILIPIYNLILFCTDSETGPNEYGENPKGIGNDGSINQIGVE